MIQTPGPWQTFNIPITIPEGYTNVILEGRCHSNQPGVAIKVRTNNNDTNWQTLIFVAAYGGQDDIDVHVNGFVLPLSSTNSFQYQCWLSYSGDFREWQLQVTGFC